MERARRVVAARISFAAAVAAFCFATVAVGNGLSHGPSRQQLELFREVAARHGLPVPPAIPPGPGFDWAGTITPGGIAVLLVVLVVFLHVTRGDRPARPPFPHPA
jgi:hypothetical protein